MQELDIEDPVVFDDKASNGTPRMKMDRVKEEYPKLFAKIMENFGQGKPFQYGELSYKVQTSDQYGNTVYQNKAKGGGSRSTSTSANNQELIKAINDLTVEIARLSQLLKGRNA